VVRELWLDRDRVDAMAVHDPLEHARDALERVPIEAAAEHDVEAADAIPRLELPEVQVVDVDNVAAAFEDLGGDLGDVHAVRDALDQDGRAAADQWDGGVRNDD